ncbi:MAG: phage tail protein [Kofleriaceae bacterium]
MSNNPGNRKDPLPVFCFKVKLDIAGGNTGEAFFKSVSGLKYETEVVPVREGGVNDTTFQLVGATKWSNLVLKQGFTGSSGLLKWRQQWLSGTMIRASGTIIQMDTALKKVAQWKFVRGWPMKWELSELDASKSELSIETLEIAHEGLIFG